MDSIKEARGKFACKTPCKPFHTEYNNFKVTHHLAKKGNTLTAQRR